MSAIQLNEKRQITIDLNWLLSALSDDQRRELIDSLSCEESVIADVSAQLLDGWTERASHGPRSCSAEVEPTNAIDKARRAIAMRSSDVAREEIEDLKRALIWHKSDADRYRDAYFKAYHAWGDRGTRMCPSIEPVNYMNRSSYSVVKEPTP